MATTEETAIVSTVVYCDGLGRWATIRESIEYHRDHSPDIEPINRHRFLPSRVSVGDPSPELLAAWGGMGWSRTDNPIN